MFGEVGNIVGQALSIVAVIVGFITFQMRSSKGILALQILSALIFAAHYLLIGAMTAAALNLVAATQCVCYYVRNLRGGQGKLLPVVFAVLAFGISILTWDDWRSAFIMVGMVLSAVMLSFSDARKIRSYNLVKAPLCLVYNLSVLSLGGTLYESASLISTLITIFRERRKGSENEEI